MVGLYLRHSSRRAGAARRAMSLTTVVERPGWTGGEGGSRCPCSPLVFLWGGALISCYPGQPFVPGFSLWSQESGPRLFLAPCASPGHPLASNLARDTDKAAFQSSTQAAAVGPGAEPRGPQSCQTKPPCWENLEGAGTPSLVTPFPAGAPRVHGASCSPKRGHRSL